MVLRAARADEATLLSELALRSKAHWNYDRAFMEACREELTLSADDITRNPTYLIEVGGQTVGFYALERLDESRTELNFLFVEPRFIGQGHGRVLMEHAKRVARELGSRTMIIQGDPNAEHFYSSAGGQKVGVRPSASIPGRVLPLFEISLG